MSLQYQLKMMVFFTVTIFAMVVALRFAGMQPYEGGCAVSGTADEVECPTR